MNERVLVLRYTDGATSVVPFNDQSVPYVGGQVPGRYPTGQSYGMVRLESVTVTSPELYELEADVLDGAELDLGTPVAQWGKPKL